MKLALSGRRDLRPRPAGGKVLALLLLTAPAGLGSPRLVAETAGRHTLRVEQVADALTAAMLPIERAEIRLLAEISVIGAAPKLEVKALEPWGEHGARVRMRCQTHEQCLPFYVAVNWTDAPAAQQALQAAMQAAAPAAPVPLAGRSAMALPVGRETRSEKMPAEKPHAGADRVPTAASHTADPPSPTIRAGTHATLVLDGTRLHIKVPVICLEPGEPGRTIRVTAADHKQIYHAEVVDGALLRGTL